MPVQPSGSSRSLTLAAVGLALGIVAVVVAFVMIVPRITEDGTVQVRLGDDRFAAGSAERRSASIDSDGPILFSDVAGGQRDIFLQHIGDDPEQGWLAFDARLPDQSRDCSLVWRAEDELFVDSCDDANTVPADGEGLVQYPVEVDDGDLFVDLNASRRAEREAEREAERQADRTSEG